MRTKNPRFSVLLFLAFSLVLAFFFQCYHQISGWTILDRGCKFSLLPLLGLTGLAFTLLLFLWLASSWTLSKLYSLKLEEVLVEDSLTLLPLAFLSLSPLAFENYIASSDLQARLRLFGTGILLAVVYLKFLEFRHWRSSIQTPRPGILSRVVSLPLRRRVLILFLCSCLIHSAGALLLVSRGLTSGGDEPHYLLITHSLLMDRDFDLANNYHNQDYYPFTKYKGQMSPHAVRGTKPGSLYSSHSPGVAILMLPFYALGRLFPEPFLLFFVRLGMALLGALFTVQVYLFARSEWSREDLALWLWFLTAFTSPVFFYAIHVYPEIIVAALSLAVFRRLRSSATFSWPGVVFPSLALSSFIWFHSLKYMGLFFPLFLYGLVVLAKQTKSVLKTALFVLIPVLITLFYLEFQHSLYGSYSLTSPTWAGPKSTEESFAFARHLLFGIPFRFRLESLAGYFLDQRDGLLFYAPLYFFAFLGAWEMGKRKKRDFLLLLALTSPYVFISAFLTQRTGYAPQARPLVAVIWVLIILLGYFLVWNEKRVFSYLFNCAAMISFLLVLLLLFSPLNLYQETTQGVTERGGGLFYLLSNLHFRLPPVLPSFIKTADWRWLPNFIWPGLLALGVTAYVFSKKSSLTLGFRNQVALVCLGLFLFFGWFVLYPRRVLLNPRLIVTPSGERSIFYSISRAARQIGPGRFELREDNRTYRFYFLTLKPIEELRLTIGSKTTAYSFSLRMFDLAMADGRAGRGMETLIFGHPPHYPLKKRYYYELFLDLGQGQSEEAHPAPCLFIIDF